MRFKGFFTVIFPLIFFTKLYLVWLLFVFVNAVYTGALTMHFATPPDFPFENLREVLRELASFFSWF